MRKFIKLVVFSFFGLFILGDYFKFRKELKKSGRRFDISYTHLRPVFFENTKETKFDRVYLYHVAWAVRCVKEINPARHVDVGSSLNFCTTLSAFIPTDFYDYRPAAVVLSGLGSYKGDLLNLPFKDNQLQSVSCLHTLEHVGLGRYGDPIDASGDLKAIKELSRVTAQGGVLLVVVPTGRESRVEFNGHRIYSYNDFTSYFPGFTLKIFSYIPQKAERGGIINDASYRDIKDDVHGCGCYWFVKK
jgi:SAM-dependent methyltransferase